MDERIENSRFKFCQTGAIKTPTRKPMDFSVAFSAQRLVIPLGMVIAGDAGILGDLFFEIKQKFVISAAAKLRTGPLL
jgi:hypothetical protein